MFLELLFIIKLIEKRPDNERTTSTSTVGENGKVTDEEDDTGFGHRCSGCDCFFHNSCTSKPVSVDFLLIRKIFLLNQ